MFEKREIISALNIAKENQPDKKILNMFDKRDVLGIINKKRWKQGASINFGFMTEQEFERIIKNRKFFSTIDKIGLKSHSRISHNKSRIPINNIHNNRLNPFTITEDSRISHNKSRIPKKQFNKFLNLQEGPNN